MDYMLAKFIWYVVFAFIIGGCVGWYTCSKGEE